ncbi:hypothetical protein HPP92_000915 [Vanilla planifolia]|uniref:Uncharacterized protein n=1 Tax=Vanilla planifolia TaxID=51239 RepID=A0A835VD31_VANPL|nr:hypothetical protein HPP92_000915 [Vanilla planifolia]
MVMNIFELLRPPQLSLLAADAEAISIHELLREQPPAGLLPKTVESYTLDRARGFLEVPSRSPWPPSTTALRSSTDWYAATSATALRSVVGLKQEELFLWLPVRGILVSTPPRRHLFDIGVARKQLSLSLFEFPPDCRPGGSKAPDAGVTQIPKGFLGRKDWFKDQR